MNREARPNISVPPRLSLALRRLVFDLWYLGRPRWDTGISPPELIAFLQDRPPGRAIDLGCGTGTNVLTMARLGWQVTGVDFAPRAIRKARRRLRAAGLTADLRVADVTRLEGIAGPFDFALDLGCFHGLDEAGKEAYLTRLRQVLAAGGHWMVYGHYRTDPARGPGFTPEDPARMQRYFRLVSRQDGFERGKRPSGYFLFQNMP